MSSIGTIAFPSDQMAEMLELLRAKREELEASQKTTDSQETELDPEVVQLTTAQPDKKRNREISPPAEQTAQKTEEVAARQLKKRRFSPEAQQKEKSPAEEVSFDQTESRCVTPPPTQPDPEAFHSPEAGRVVANIAEKLLTPDFKREVQRYQDTPNRRARGRAVRAGYNRLLGQVLPLKRYADHQAHESAIRKLAQSPDSSRALYRMTAIFDECEHPPEEEEGGKLTPSPGKIVNFEHVTKAKSGKKGKIIGGHFLDVNLLGSWQFLHTTSTGVLFGTQHKHNRRIVEEIIKTFFPMPHASSTEADKLTYLLNADILARSNSHKLLKKANDGIVFEVFLSHDEVIMHTAFPWLDYITFENDKTYNVPTIGHFSSSQIHYMAEQLFKNPDVNPISFVIDEEDGSTNLVIDLGPTLFNEKKYVIGFTTIELTRSFPRFGFVFPKEAFEKTLGINLEDLITAARRG